MRRRSSKRIQVLALLLLCFVGFSASAMGQGAAEVSLVWNQSPHNAFTDLIRFQEQFVCTFREAKSHVPRDRSGDGKIRLVVSRDGKQWESWQLIEKDSVDLRDSKLSVTSDGRLMVLMGGSYYDRGKLLKRIPYVKFFDPKEKRWSELTPIRVEGDFSTPFDWLWRVTWREGKAYGVIYQNNKKPWGLHLVESDNGIDYRLIKTFSLPGRPNESTIRFNQRGEMVMVVRNEDASVRGHVGYSRSPYKQWRWFQTDARLGGPNFVFLPDGSMVLGSRRYSPQVKTILAGLQPNGRIRSFLEMPSGGDTSYPGMLIHDGHLCVSYYSSHEGRTSIYFYRQKIDKVAGMSRQARFPAKKKFVAMEDKNRERGNLLYRLLKPEKVEKDKKYPLVIFLHGAGERGKDNVAQLVHMDDFASREVMQKFPCFVFAPQCPKNKFWVNTDWRDARHQMSDEPNAVMKRVVGVLDQLIDEYPIDTDRIYVTGLSMGGFGAWEMISRYPDRFAAAAPICGGGDSSKKVVQAIKDIPIYVVHGDSDRAVMPKRSVDMVEALRSAGGKPIFKMLENTGHNSWTPTYSDPGFYEWMFKQKKKR